MVIVVTATRIPQPLVEVGTTTSVVSAASMQAQRIRTAVDALREVPACR
jgi:outer membrane cobalamin receptor